MRLSLYTDGASHSRGNLPGGWAWVLVNGDGPLKCGTGGLEATTNNVMELYAIKSGLGYVLQQRDAMFPTLAMLDVVSDSQYALRISSSRFRPSKNIELADATRRLARALEITGVEINWCWVRGHAGHTWNERADRLAHQAKQRVMEAVSRRRKETSGDSP